MKKVILLVLDSVGIGELPDAAKYGDEGCNTLCHIAENVDGLNLPNLAALGLARILPVRGVADPAEVLVMAAYKLSKGKDTTTGRWEIADSTKDPLPTFPDGFPPELIGA